jgi:hypothetical protein
LLPAEPVHYGTAMRMKMVCWFDNQPTIKLTNKPIIYKGDFRVVKIGKSASGWFQKST